MATETITKPPSTPLQNPPQDPIQTLSIKIEFTGGLELLFSNKKHHAISIPAKTSSKSPTTVSDLISFLCSNLLQDVSRKDMFVLEDTVRPGILVLINDADWELEGEGAYVLEDGDEVVFVSTLHGG